jgi:hypothetical protein
MILVCRGREAALARSVPGSQVRFQSPMLASPIHEIDNNVIQGLSGIYAGIASMIGSHLWGKFWRVAQRVMPTVIAQRIPSVTSWLGNNVVKPGFTIACGAKVVASRKHTSALARKGTKRPPRMKQLVNFPMIYGGSAKNNNASTTTWRDY